MTIAELRAKVQDAEDRIFAILAEVEATGVEVAAVDLARVDVTEYGSPYRVTKLQAVEIETKL